MPEILRYSADVLVIGSGAGGATVAARLSKAGYDVLVVEEGIDASDKTYPLHSPEALASMYRNGGVTPIHSRPSIAFVEGSCLGGSTEVNSAFWHRPDSDAVERWREHFGLESISPADIDPIARPLEERLSVRLPELLPHEEVDPLRVGATALGLNPILVPRAQGDRGNLNQFAIGAKNSMSRTFIPDAIENGATILTSTRIERIVTSGGSASAAHGVTRDGIAERKVRIDAKYIFVCAGATQSPTLLKKSGIRHNVGKNFRFHPMVKMVAEGLPETDRREMPLSPWQLRDHNIGETLGGSVFSHGYLAMARSGGARTGDPLIRDWKSSAIYYASVKSSTSGAIRQMPLIGSTYITYRLNQRDRTNLQVAARRLATVLLAGGATRVVLDASRPDQANGVTDPENITWDESTIEKLNISTVHAFSSCASGETEHRTAVDSWGKVHGYDNLYVADASVLPDSPGVNPQGTVMIFASRIAEEFVERNR